MDLTQAQGEDRSELELQALVSVRDHPRRLPGACLGQLQGGLLGGGLGGGNGDRLRTGFGSPSSGDERDAQLGGDATDHHRRPSGADRRYVMTLEHRENVGWGRIRVAPAHPADILACHPSAAPNRLDDIPLSLVGRQLGGDRRLLERVAHLSELRVNVRHCSCPSMSGVGLLYGDDHVEIEFLRLGDDTGRPWIVDVVA